MKVNFKLLTAFILSVSMNYSAFCQWQLTGNPLAPGQFLGSTNNQPLDFRTNNIQRMSIGSTGLVGIGNL